MPPLVLSPSSFGLLATATGRGHGAGSLLSQRANTTPLLLSWVVSLNPGLFPGLQPDWGGDHPSLSQMRKQRRSDLFRISS